MIRSALIALGLSASGLGATGAQGQGIVPASPVVETCGGMRFVLEATGDGGDLDHASDVMNARIAGVASPLFDYTDIEGDRIILSVPQAVGAEAGAIEPLLVNVGFAIYGVERFELVDNDITLSDQQFVLGLSDKPDQMAVLQRPPIVTGPQVDSARPDLDQNGRPAISFAFTPDGSAAFGSYTMDDVGSAIAIVLRDEVVSAPRIASPILGGRGIISGNFTQNEVEAIVSILNGGVLPFEVTIVAQDTIDGSDPSADFCP